MLLVQHPALHLLAERANPGSLLGEVDNFRTFSWLESVPRLDLFLSEVNYPAHRAGPLNYKTKT